MPARGDAELRRIVSRLHGVSGVLKPSRNGTAGEYELEVTVSPAPGSQSDAAELVVLSGDGGHPFTYLVHWSVETPVLAEPRQVFLNATGPLGAQRTVTIRHPTIGTLTLVDYKVSGDARLKVLTQDEGSRPGELRIKISTPKAVDPMDRGTILLRIKGDASNTIEDLALPVVVVAGH